jgi:hypothetical protein
MADITGAEIGGAGITKEVQNTTTQQPAHQLNRHLFH